MQSWRFLCSKLSIVPFVVLSTALWSSREGQLMQSFYADVWLDNCFSFYSSTNQYFAQWSQSSYIWHTAEAQISKLLVFLGCRTVGAKSLKTKVTLNLSFLLTSSPALCWHDCSAALTFVFQVKTHFTGFSMVQAVPHATLPPVNAHSKTILSLREAFFFLFFFFFVSSPSALSSVCHVEAGKARPLPRCPMTLIHITDSLLL